MRFLLIFCMVAFVGCGGRVMAEQSGDETCTMPQAVGDAPGTEQSSSGLCSMQAVDAAGHTFRAVCDAQGCDCYYDQSLLCSCPARQGWASTCSNGIPVCCKGFPYKDIELTAASR